MTEDFRRALISGGLLVDTGIPGVYGRSGAFESAVEGLNRLISRAGADQDARTVHFPPIMPRADFERTGYVQNFPDLLGSVHGFAGDDKAHRRMLQRADAGEDWTSELRNSGVFLTSSACHPLYPTLTGSIPAEGLRVDLIGWCFRSEPSLDPGRMQAFRQREYVYVGSAEGALAHRDLWADRGLSLLKGLGLPAEAVPANDPFFGRVGRLLANEQREAALKIELIAPISDVDRPTAIASANLAEDHFGHAFAMMLPDGTPAHSACIGFGVDRIVLALARQYGAEPDAWPRLVKSELWP